MSTSNGSDVADPLRVRMVIQPTVSHYRGPLIDRLLASEQVAFDLYGRATNSELADARDQIRATTEEHLARVEIITSHDVGPFRWESTVVPGVLRGGHDVYVLEGRIFNVSTWVALLLGRLLRRQVYLWGHGWKRPEGGLKRYVRLRFYALARGLFLYGDFARRLAISYGYPEDRVVVVYNSMYSRETIASAARLTESTSDVPAAGDPEGVLIVSCRLTGRHKLHLLADALDILGSQGKHPAIVIIGDGSARQSLEERYRESSGKTHFAGGVYDRDALAGWYALADLAVSPAASGLNVIQSLGFGVPIVVPDSDPNAGPEAEAVEEDVNGARFAHDDPTALAAVIARLLRDREQLERLGDNGRRLVLARYTADLQARAFEEGLASRPTTKRRSLWPAGGTSGRPARGRRSSVGGRSR